MSEETVLKADEKKKEGVNKWATALISAGVLMLAVNLLGIDLMNFLWLYTDIMMPKPASKVTAEVPP